jgi:hypothetical protein
LALLKTWVVCGCFAETERHSSGGCAWWNQLGRMKWGERGTMIFAPAVCLIINTEELECGRSLERFPEIVSLLKSILERFDAQSCIDQCFIPTKLQLPASVQVGRTKVGGIDFN